MSALAENLEKVRGRIQRACERAGRDPAGVTLLAVSKNHPATAVEEASRLGLSYFGESRIQEARVKIPQCPNRLHWHMIGHLQSNKVKDALGLFEMIESIDSLALAEELQKQAEKQARYVKILLEINVAGESSKHGWDPVRVLEDFETVNRFSRLEIHGLMTIAPYAVDPEKVRPVFSRLRELRDRCAEKLGAPVPVLSMGMSGDLEVAIEEGATLVRVGTALFGERPKRDE